MPTQYYVIVMSAKRPSLTIYPLFLFYIATPMSRYVLIESIHGTSLNINLSYWSGFKASTIFRLDCSTSHIYLSRDVIVEYCK